MRLDQFLSARTMYSRRELRQMIQKGKVTVDGAVVRKADQAVQPEAHTVCLNGREICGDQYLYVLLHKPKGYVSSADEGRTEKRAGTGAAGTVPERSATSGTAGQGLHRHAAADR